MKKKTPKNLHGRMVELYQKDMKSIHFPATYTELERCLIEKLSALSKWDLHEAELECQSAMNDSMQDIALPSMAISISVFSSCVALGIATLSYLPEIFALLLLAILAISGAYIAKGVFELINYQLEVKHKGIYYQFKFRAIAETLAKQEENL